MNWMRIAIVAVVAFLAWTISRSIDGPIVHFAITGLAVWLAWTHTSGMGAGG